jgi:hypothetical protein
LVLVLVLALALALVLVLVLALRCSSLAAPPSWLCAIAPTKAGTPSLTGTPSARRSVRPTHHKVADANAVRVGRHHGRDCC